MDPLRPIFRTAKTVYLRNGDQCTVASWVLFQRSPAFPTLPELARVSEIIQYKGSSAEREGIADFVLLEVAVLGRTHTTFSMPTVVKTSWRLLSSFEVSKLTFLPFVSLTAGF